MLLARVARSVAIIACALALTSACGQRRAAPPVVVPPDAAPQPESAPSTAPDRTAAALASEPAACRLGAESGEPVVSVGLTDAVSASSAPYPANASEGIVFRQIYESPLRIDCEGTPRPALAESWQAEPDGTWTLTLRADARFTDGVPVTAGALAAAWTDSATGAPAVRIGRHVVSATALDDRRIAVRLREGVSAPDVFAHPDLAVVRHVPDDAWPLGTRGVRPEPDPARGATTGQMQLTLSPVAPSAAAIPDLPPPLGFRIAPGADPRDLLDAGTDLLVTRDARALEYAGRLGEFEAVPLGWDRTYLLVSRTAGPPQPLSEDGREALARGAVRGEARGAAAVDWLDAAACPRPPAPTRPAVSTPTRRIVYDASDETARDLAERIVALAATRSPMATAVLDGLLPPSHQSVQRAVGLAGQELVAALRSGTDAALIVPVARTTVNPCDAIDSLLLQIPWFDPRAAVPLVETRARAVIRQGRSGVVYEGGGAIRLDRAALVGRRPE